MTEKISIRDGNKGYVENFLRLLDGKVSWYVDTSEEKYSKQEMEKLSGLPKVIIAPKKFSNDSKGHYVQSIRAMKNLPEYRIILNGPFETGLKGLREDLKHFANAKEINPSEIRERARKYGAMA